jgi:formin-binding protein 1
MTTWTVQLTTLESRAAEHDRYAGQLIANLADPLKHLQIRYEELRKVHSDFAAKLEKERDGAYSDLRKVKGRYDSVCQEVENRRKKTDGAFDAGKSKAQLAYQQQHAEMNNVKVCNEAFGISIFGRRLTPSRIPISLTSMSRTSRRSDTTTNTSPSS